VSVDSDSEEDAPLDEILKRAQSEVIVAPTKEEEAPKTREALTAKDEQYLQACCPEWALRLIPPVADGPLIEPVQAKIRAQLEKLAEGINFNQVIQSQQEFHNPSFFDNVIRQFGIDPLGSNLDANWGGGVSRRDDYQILLKEAEQMQELRAVAREKAVSRAAVIPPVFHRSQTAPPSLTIAKQVEQATKAAGERARRKLG
jgi:hypothetical protein